MLFGRIYTDREQDKFGLLCSRFLNKTLKYVVAWKSSFTLLLISLAILFSLGIPSLAQDFPDNCVWTCTQEDVTVEYAWLADFDPCDYEPGDIVPVDVNITVRNNGASDRYCLYLWADLINLDDPSKNVEIKQLVPGGEIIPGAPGGLSTNYTLCQIDWTYGDNLILDVHLVTWVTSKSDSDNCSNTLDCGSHPSAHCGENYTLSILTGIPDLNVTKSVKFLKDAKGDIILGPPTVGDKITYEYIVTNTGNVRLMSLAVMDIRGPSPGIETPITLNTTSLLNFQDKASGFYEYTVGKNDVCSNITNYAVASANADVCGEILIASDTSETIQVPTNYTASINITKEANLSSAQLGDVIEYTYTVENTGNVNLSSIAVEDNRLGTINETE